MVPRSLLVLALALVLGVVATDAITLREKNQEEIPAIMDPSSDTTPFQGDPGMEIVDDPADLAGLEQAPNGNSWSMNAPPAAPAAPAAPATPTTPQVVALQVTPVAQPQAIAPAVAASAAAAPVAQPVAAAVPVAAVAPAPVIAAPIVSAAPAVPALIAQPPPAAISSPYVAPVAPVAAAAPVVMDPSFQSQIQTNVEMEGGDGVFGQIGSGYTFLLSGDDWNANSEVSNGYSNPAMNLGECQKKCLTHPDCVVGMWGTSGKRKGQCWLSSKKREAAIACSSPCLSFERRDVAHKNMSPVVSHIPAATAYKSTLFQLDMATHFSDPDGDTLTYSLEGIPPLAGLEINNFSGLITGTPTQFATEALQPFFVHVVAEDGKGGKTQGTLRLSISAAQPQ